MTTHSKLILFVILVMGLTVKTAGASGNVGENAPTVSFGAKVTMEFTVTVPAKPLALKIEGGDPLSYVQGGGQVNPALEAALYGLRPGDRKRVVLSPHQGFGQYDASKQIIVPKENLPPGIHQGMILHDPTGHLVTVARIADDSVTLDLNHPFAGQPLVIDMHILNVEQVTHAL
jgi:FKBP-type peptidyl-prolyl cis-trans isomerase SlyD